MKHSRAILILALLLAFTAGHAAQSENADSAPFASRYPNELPAFRFYETARWRSLELLVSSIQDVRREMGEPLEANDLAQDGAPYPGDAEAKAPLFRYKINSGKWQVLIYFSKDCFHGHPKDVHSNRLCSIDLIPAKRVSFKFVKFPPVFKKKHVVAADAAWDEYSDGTGLSYEVYTTRTPYGNEQQGDLNRISYGHPAGIRHY